MEDECCAVCGDRVNSKRYGVPACLGCIVFFRRAVVNNSQYKCVKYQNCSVTNGPDLLKTMASFQKYQTAQHSLFFDEQDLANGRTTESKIAIHRRRARVPDVNIMLKLCLNQATDWGNQFQPFSRLSTESKQNILAEYTFGFLLVDQGFKTAYEAEDGFWLFPNGTFMHSDYYYGLAEEDGRKENSRLKAHFHFKFVSELLTCVITPFRNLQIDDVECVALKIVLLLTPSFSKRAVYAGQEEAVAALHTKCMSELMEHAERRFPGRGEERFGEILLLVSSIRCGVKAMYNQTRVSDVFNIMEFDPFVRDMLLN
uniref:NR LBD domain-containing protein n=1 Tax=Caenorhabditis japonica TaxID=281687 RepID=A0A8R1HR66_CAEJA